MNRRWNLAIWLGLVVVLVAAATYLPLVDRLPFGADWVTLSIFLAGVLVIAAGLARAFRDPVRYRGKVSGSLVMALGLSLTSFFAFGAFVAGRQVPVSGGAPRVGQLAPDFALIDPDGRTVSLSDLLGPAGGERANGALLIFYRGYW